MQGAEKHTVLLVDDDGMIRSYLSLILRNEGFVIDGEAGDVAKAKQHLKRSPTSVVFLDINLPDEDGLSALKALRTDYPDICFIMISGEATAPNVKAAIEEGAKGFVTKPFTVESVTHAVSRALDL